MLKYASIILFLLAACTKKNLTTTNYRARGFVNDSTALYVPPDSVLHGGDYNFYAICIDNKNNKWLDTDNGIFRFDGTNWTFYNYANTSIDFTHWLTSQILSDNDGNIFVLSGSRMAVFQNNSWKEYHLPFYFDTMRKDPVTNSIYFFTVLNSEAVLCKLNAESNFTDSANYTIIDLGEKKGVSDYIIYNNKIFSTVSHPSISSADSSTLGILVQDQNGSRTFFGYADFSNSDSVSRAFTGIATSNGRDVVMFENDYFRNLTGVGLDPDLFYFNGSTWTTVPIPDGAAYKIAYAKNGSLWIDYNGSGLAESTNNVFAFHPLNINNSYAQCGITDFAIDENNVKWIASSCEGLISYKEHNP